MDFPDLLGPVALAVMPTGGLFLVYHCPNCQAANQRPVEPDQVRSLDSGRASEYSIPKFTFCDGCNTEFQVLFSVNGMPLADAWNVIQANPEGPPLGASITYHLAAGESPFDWPEPTGGEQ